MVEETKLDTNLYSRQIGTFGLETMGKLIKMNVLIVGMRGLGVEIAKNIILAGPKSVTLYDPTEVAVADRGSNFYITEAHVGNTTRAEACKPMLAELNPYVQVTSTPQFTNEDVTNYNVIVITENFWGSERLVQVNELCRANRVGFILSENMGLASYAFLDYGPEFVVTDSNGERTNQFIVASIEQGENPLVHVHEDKRHSYQDGDFVKFTEVEGMTQLNDAGPIEIYDCRGFSFKLKTDTSSFSAYERQGVVEDVKMPKKVAFQSLAESMVNPAAATEFGFLEPIDMNYFGMGRSEQLHFAISAVHAFRNTEGRYPENNAADLAKTLDFAKASLAANKAKEGALTVEEIDESICNKVAAYSTCSITSMAAFFGGFIAQEVVKATGKYMPLKQWAHYDCFESLPAGDVNREPMNCRYDDQIKIYGREVQEKLGNVKTFMVGAGALGCEYVKAMALMGLACGPNGSVTVTDNDNIEVSNLNRQFLFRQPDVGKSKAETACAKAKIMNPDLKVTTYQTFVCPDTEDLFNDDFWESLDYIVNAVDNIKARLYVDAQCVWYEKPLLESGTLGTKANSQMIVPHVTQAYGDSKDPEDEDSIPMCTLRNFPNQIEHCIEWGRDQFNTLFCSRVQDAIEFIRDPVALVAQMRQNGTSSGVREQLENVSRLMDIKKTGDITRVVTEARDIFNSRYDHSIRDLLNQYPQDATTREGQPFWSGPKRCPSPEAFNAEDPIHIEFVWTCANLMFANFGLPSLSREDVKAAVSSLPAAEYVQKDVFVETPEEQKEREEAGRPAPSGPPESEDDEPAIAQLLESLRESTANVAIDSIVAAEFEKDDDSNFHIDYINASANLRARNYKIVECDRNKTKMIAGKIIPAIATTTAMITGAVSNEIFKYTQGFTDIAKFKNCFLNLALPVIQFTQPSDTRKKKSKEYDTYWCGPVTMIPEGFTNYDKIVLNGSMTFQALLDWLKTEKGVDIDSINSGEDVQLFMFMPGNKNAAKMTRTIEDVYREVSKKEIPAGRRYLQLEVAGSVIENRNNFEMPPIKYYFA